MTRSSSSAETDVEPSRTIRVHDPRGYPPEVIGKQLAPRLENLEGKAIYLVDCLFDNSDVFVEQLRSLVRRAPAGHRGSHRAPEGKLGR